MTSALLYINIFFLIYLSVFAICFIVIFLVSLFLKKKKINKEILNSQEENEINNKSLSVLVPSMNEGEMVIDSLNSLLAQNHKGEVKIYLLIKDLSDTSISYLEKYFKFKFKQNKEDKIIDFYNKNNFQINLVLTGFDLKNNKLNYIIPSLNSDYIGIIDVDHRPSVNWISSSLSLFKNDNIAYVQTKRAPLNLSTLPQIWDSSQNHGGNELLNLVLSVNNKNVFFTGTAAIFKEKILKENLFSNSITEDTELSYKLLYSNYKSAYNSQACSYEEVAPTLKSYVLRRRRWSAGHSGVFVNNIKNIISSKTSFSFRLISFFHGQFYFIPLAVFAILSVYGIHYFNQLAQSQKLAVIIFSLFLSFLFSYIFKSAKKINILEFIASFLWLWPQVTVLSIFILHLGSFEAYYYILSFPLEKELSLWKIFLYFIPLLTIVMSIFKVKGFRRWQNIVYFITYPISMFFDIYAGFLGFIDLIFSSSKWTTIVRQNSYSDSLVDKEVSKNFLSKKSNNNLKRKYLYFILSGILVLFIANDLLAVNNCGQIQKFLWKPLIIKANTNLVVKTNITKEIISEGSLLVKANANISVLPDDYYVKTYLNKKLVYEGNIVNSNFTFFEKEIPLGFDNYDLYVEFNSSKGNSRNMCYRDLNFTSTKKEIKDSKLYLNGEEFLIKGIIPSFLGNNIDLDMESGFSQLKEIGFNTLRFYHGATDKIISVAAMNDLMIIDQPDNSTWGNFNIFNDFQVDKFINSYIKTINSNSANPYSLFTGFGNEWELESKGENNIFTIFEIIKKAKTKIESFPSSYSSYFTFLDFPVDILGINMLDTGDIYWDKAVSKLEENKTVYYASEFGGFTAFLEKTVPEIRFNRILKEWNILLSSGAQGANFYESHDNWAQSIPKGYNNPNRAEQNDDLRGFWDEENNEKLELRALKLVLSDIEIINNFESEEIKNCSDEYVFKFQNIRNYNLKNVSLEIMGSNYYLGDFYPQEKKEFILNSSISKEEKLNLKFSYTTHSGLKNYSLISFQVPCFGDSVKVINNDVIIENNNSQLLKAKPISSGKINFVIPNSWNKFSINDRQYINDKSFYSIDIGGPYYEVNNLQYSLDKKNWKTYNEDVEIGGGLYYFKFLWPDIDNYNSYLIIEGSGANEINFDLKYGSKEIAVHSYRENVIHLSSLGNIKTGDEIIYSINRDMIKYVDSNVTKSFNVPLIYNDDLIVNFIEPKVFSINDFEVKKIN